MLELTQMDYRLEKICLRLKTRPVSYDQDCRPTDPAAYRQMDRDFERRDVPDLWESMLPGGQGWLGVVDKAADKLIEGDFKTYSHSGSYEELLFVGKKIGGSHPAMTEFYFVYLDSPLDLTAEKLRVKIVFKE